MLPYNTLAQMLVSESQPSEVEVVLLLPWDFVPECDWRSGMPANLGERDELYRRASETAARLAARVGARLFYLAAPILPIFPNPSENALLAGAIAAHAQALGARILPSDHFALGTYLASGCPIAGSRLGDVAELIIHFAGSARPEPRKVLITDFDDVLWHGVIGEDGLDGIACAPEGAGFRHFLYQTFLLRLKAEGVLLVGVSRNHPADALAPLRAGRTVIGESDFVTILASYHAKSAQIKAVSAHLNLGLHDFVFVDDNPLELAEVTAELPEVMCLKFPESDHGLLSFFQELRQLFARQVVTAEDRQRTSMYRRRMDALIPAESGGADLRAFLNGLNMRLTIHNWSTGNRERAVQLINKTNQFNLNGRRFTDAEIVEILASGGQLYAASLVDRTGSHGEILACLISAAGIVESFALSCRVFERRIEHAFLIWLASEQGSPKAFRYLPTTRNEPIRQFFKDPAFAAVDGDLVTFDAGSFVERRRSDLDLFTVTRP